MKKSLVALTFAMLISVYPALMFVLIKELDNPNGMTPDGINYGWVMYLFLILGCSVVVGLAGSIMAWIAYVKNKPNLILYGIILLGINALICFGYPLYMMGPLPLLIMGFLAYRDVKKIEGNAVVQASSPIN